MFIEREEESEAGGCLMHPIWRSLLVFWFVLESGLIAAFVAALGEYGIRYRLGLEADAFPFAALLAGTAAAIGAYRLTRRKPVST